MNLQSPPSSKLLTLTLVGIIIILLIAGFILLHSQSATVQNTPNEDLAHDHSAHVHPEPITDDTTKKVILSHKTQDFILNPGKPITVTTYSDTDCKFCKLQMQRIDALLQEERYADTVSVVFRYGELPIYEKSPEEGLRLECVGRITGDTAAYYDFKTALLVDIQSSSDFDPARLDQMALTYVDEAPYRACLEDPEVTEYLHFLVRQAHSIGVRTLPHNFLFTQDSQLIEFVGSMRPEFLRATLDSLIDAL